jgi:YfiR/HmsC-like
MVAMTLRLALAALALWTSCAWAQGDVRAAEVRIKAAFLYRFGDFVQWPQTAFARPDSAFVIGVLGADEIAAELEQIVADRRIQGRPVTVRKLRRGDSAAGLHMLFVGEAETKHLPELIAAIRGRAVLTVTEADEGLAAGSMINFVAADDKVRFDVALPPAERDQLKISSRLLSVARRVVTSS